ncbi:hypothetical protein E3T61_09915 [Cryobacterium lactosi]|uniref:Uncharacterized protein n=1 Tax=Cryobacterium lactosi TaxID=1259202 RepID=A0A4R9BTR5_9MICO|nr:hypothetical protein [Cryobacterium lactosi]TFD90819.1 hypothetical protein E3T61_09915 [Cryobacterium lactosi]
MSIDYPRTMQFSFPGFAELDVVVTRNSALNGNSGSSSVRFNVGAGNIWLGEEIREFDSAREFTIQLSGEDEHRNLAQAFRAAADELDRA